MRPALSSKVCKQKQNPTLTNASDPTQSSAQREILMNITILITILTRFISGELRKIIVNRFGCHVSNINRIFIYFQIYDLNYIDISLRINIKN